MAGEGSGNGPVVAVKMLHEHLAADPVMRARFDREVESVLRLSSPYIVNLIGYGQRAETPYLVMEYVHGRTLEEVVRAERSLEWPRARRYVCDIAHALAAAHGGGIVHRDVKPSNLILDASGHLRLTDFGIARAMDSANLTAGGLIIGTPAYMAPDPRPLPASDLYSMGCVLFFMLVGRPPFEGESHYEVVLKHANEAPQLNLVHDDEALALLESLLSKRAPDRPTASELIRQLGCDPVIGDESLLSAFGPGQLGRASAGLPLRRRARILRTALWAVVPSPFVGLACLALAKLAGQLPSIESWIDDDGYIWFAGA